MNRLVFAVFMAATLDPSGNPLWRTSNVVQVSVQ